MLPNGDRQVQTVHNQDTNITSPGKWDNLKFGFCQMLSNAVFDENAYINAFKGSLRQVDLPPEILVDLIDTMAKNHLDNLMTNLEDIDSESAKRFACYSVVSSKSMTVKYDVMLKNVDPVMYFPFLSINKITKPIVEIPSKFDKKTFDVSNIMHVSEAAYIKHDSFRYRLVDPFKKRYKIAYFVMAHENKGRLSAMMEALYSTEAIYLIHIDAHYPDFKKQIIEWVHVSEWDNVHVMSNSFYCQWGGSSLVFAELEGFFQLMDLAEWDYVINLSSEDYPIANTSTIHDILERTPQKSYLATWMADEETFRRISFAGIVSKSKKDIVVDYKAPRLFTLGDRFFPMKQLQWMTLSRAFVDMIKKFQSSYDLLAYMEFSLIPDESYFGMIAASPELQISDMIISTLTHLAVFLPEESHPRVFHDGDEDIIFSQKGPYFFVRKIDASTDTKLKASLDNYRNDYPIWTVNPSSEM